MIKHVFSVVIIILIFAFIFFTYATYMSQNNQVKIKTNRANTYLKIKESLTTLPLLRNDTMNVIEFNSGYNDDSKKIKRNFWKLFKKND